MGDGDPWSLRLVVRLSLAREEISSPGEVQPVYLLAPRHAYLPALAQQCMGFFQHVLLNLPGQSTPDLVPWFEQNGVPLNWTQPLGVLHDLLAAGACLQQQQQQLLLLQAAVPGAPWCLTVHYRSPPASLQQPWQNASGAQEQFLSSLKEAGYCCRGSEGVGAVMRLPGRDQDALWDAVNAGDGAAVKRMHAQLRLAPAIRPGAPTPSVPVRIFIRSHAGGIQQDSAAPDPGCAVWEQSFSTSRPFDVLQQDGSDTLLAHVMHAVMPQHFAAPVPQGSSRGEQLLLEQPMATAQEAADAALQQEQELLVESELPALQLETPAQLQSQPEPTPTTRQDEAAADPEQPTLLPAAAVSDSSLAAAAADEKCDRTASDNQAAAASHVGRLSELPPHVLPAVGWAPAVAVVCGVQPPWTTPLGWLYGHFRSADGFLYIVVHLLSSLL